jgi:hypothetical protein
MGSLSTWEVLIMGLIPLGQLWARIFNFNGSLDKWWLMFPLFLVPPFSFIPLILMKMGFVADGSGTNPLDYWILCPILTKIITDILMDDSTPFQMVTALLIQLISVLASNLMRRYENCNRTITVNSVGKAIIDSVTAFGMGSIVQMLIPMLPFVGIFFSLISMIPIIGTFVSTFIWILGFAGSYILINMFNQVSMNNYCSSPFTGTLSDRVPFVIGIIGIIVSKLLGTN